MKLEIEVYNLYEDLFYLKDNKVSKFKPKSLKIESKYMGYSGDNWGDVSCGRGGGFPIYISYGDGGTHEEWVRHYELFRTKEELLKSL